MYGLFSYVGLLIGLLRGKKKGQVKSCFRKISSLMVFSGTLLVYNNAVLIIRI